MTKPDKYGRGLIKGTIGIGGDATVIPAGRWEGKRYVCLSDTHLGISHLGDRGKRTMLVDGQTTHPDDVTSVVRCNRGGLHQVVKREPIGWRERPLLLRRLRGLLSRLAIPGMTSCNRCWTTWEWVAARDVKLTDTSSCFFLCRGCWSQTNLWARLKYARKSWERYWKSQPFGVYSEAVRRASHDEDKASHKAQKLAEMYGGGNE